MRRDRDEAAIVDDGLERDQYTFRSSSDVPQRDREASDRKPQSLHRLGVSIRRVLNRPTQAITEIGFGNRELHDEGVALSPGDRLGLLAFIIGRDLMDHVDQYSELCPLLQGWLAGGAANV